MVITVFPVRKVCLEIGAIVRAAGRSQRAYGSNWPSWRTEECSNNI
jgi:hypothetical protein